MIMISIENLNVYTICVQGHMIDIREIMRIIVVDWYDYDAMIRNTMISLW